MEKKETKKSTAEIVKSVMKKNPGKETNFYILKTLEEINPKIKDMNFKDIKRVLTQKGFPSIATIYGYIRDEKYFDNLNKKLKK